ncbi:MAG: hypothetical protein JWM05_1532, partial [Acidimicrobiales bacterium]|nr:hypothetical protein [Acidimicrobiales bacterium]
APRVAPGAIPTLPASSGLVVRAYQRILGRPATRAESAAWGAVIDGGGREHAMRDIVVSAESLGRQVDRLYLELLHRVPAPADRAWWVARVADSGGGVERAAVAMAASTEARGGADATAAASLDRLYQGLLGRPIDPDASTYWQAQLAGGRTYGSVARAVLLSDESAGRTIRRAYRTVFDRPADAAGLAHWRPALRSARVGELDLEAALAASTELERAGCDPLGGPRCLLPFPNDHFTVPDALTATGRRVALTRGLMPANVHGVRVDPRQTNRSDGFSVGEMAQVMVPGVDLAKTGATPVTDLARYADASAPVVVLDATTGQRWPVWAEIDSTAPAAGRPGNQLLLIRPARAYAPGHRYVVALRKLRNASGALIPPSAAFRAYRDDGPEPAGIDGFESRRPAMEALFTTLAAAEIGRSDLFLTWDFTIASQANTTGRLLHLRDDALARLAGHAPAFHVTAIDQNPRTGVARRVRGTFQVPSYLTQDAPGGTFLEGPDGLPRYAGHDLTATFTCMVPTTALSTAARPVVYGHGLFGGQGEVEGQRMITASNMLYCATDWLGMASADLSSVLGVVGDLSLFPKLADRTQQGILATVLLGRLLHTADGLVSDPAFRTQSSSPVFDPSAVYYDGNSQGGILGGIATAISTEWTRAVLGVTGMDFTLLIERSVDFAPFDQLLSQAYPDNVDRKILSGMLQLQWDRSEPVGYAAALTSDPLPNTPAHKVLLHVAVGDHQVASIAADMEARTAGIPAHLPAVGPGRSTDVTPLWGIAAASATPYDGSELVYWDSGALLAPTTNTPPSAGHDPHGDPRVAALVIQQKDAFLRPGGTVTDPCNGQPCVIPEG